MRVCAAQFKPKSGDVDYNLAQHQRLAELAVRERVDVLFFSELSLTGYEPTLAQSLAIDPNDPCFKPLQTLSRAHKLTIGIGLPTDASSGVRISLLWLHSDRTRELYSKQILHADEQPFFVSGDHNLMIDAGQHKLASAICYESLHSDHAQSASALGADFYLASVAKDGGGLTKAQQHYPKIAKRYRMWVLMANAYGPCDNFIASGCSQIWNQDGEAIGGLGPAEDAIIGVDTASNRVIRAVSGAL